ncbi:MAG: hypothetical protein KBF31_00790 [Chitinophagales bacterium]|nr:hypothetical protein [Chitinophagales bacterium]
MQKYNCLYIHGLDSSPLKEKLDILKASGMNVFALHIDYRNQKNSYDLLENFAKKNEINFIVGSSLGGYIGFWLAEQLGIPCLLLNPALAYRSIDNVLVPPIGKSFCPLRIIVLGKLDDVVLSQDTLKWLDVYPKSKTIERIFECHWLAHGIDLNTFKEFTVLSVQILEHNLVNIGI